MTGSRGDGFVLSRGTQNVTITGSEAERNNGNGFTISGLPLARGPSASGESLRSFGGSSVTSSTARDNGRYGVEIQGGVKLVVQTTEVIGGEMGIVVSQDATGVRLSGNRLTGQRTPGNRAPRRGAGGPDQRQHRPRTPRPRSTSATPRPPSPPTPSSPPHCTRSHCSARPRAPRSPKTPWAAPAAARSTRAGRREPRPSRRTTPPAGRTRPASGRRSSGSPSR